MSATSNARVQTSNSATPSAVFPWQMAPTAFALWLTVGCIGLVFVFSSTVDSAVHQGGVLSYVTRQFIALLLGMASMIVLIQVPSTWFIKNRDLLFFISVVGLISVLLFGKTVNGSTRWINLGGVNLQISEFARVLFLVYLAGYLAHHVDRAAGAMITLSQCLRPFLLAGVLGGLLMMAPDFGSTVMLMLVLFGLLFLFGLSWGIVGAVGLVLSCAAGVFIWLEPYRWDRVIAFLDPWQDPQGTGYQLIQAHIAVSKGGWFGEGLGGSIQKLNYLPEAHTDFIFSVIVEEIGILGGFAILLLLLQMSLLFLRAGRKALQRHKNFHAGYLFGLALMIGGQSLFNVMVNLGLLPTKGMTLPFISYGGSSVLAFSMAVGIGIRMLWEIECGNNSHNTRTPPRMS